MYKVMICEENVKEREVLLNVLSSMKGFRKEAEVCLFYSHEEMISNMPSEADVIIVRIADGDDMERLTHRIRRKCITAVLVYRFPEEREMMCPDDPCIKRLYTTMSKRETKIRLSEIWEHMRLQRNLPYIYLEDAQTEIKICADEILYVEQQETVCNVYLAKGLYHSEFKRPLKYNGVIHELKEELSCFELSDANHLVNILYIKAITKDGIVLERQEKLNLSPKKRVTMIKSFYELCINS